MPWLLVQRMSFSPLSKPYLAESRCKGAGSVKGAVELGQVLSWYFSKSSTRRVFSETPFYCDSARVGHFAVDGNRLAAGDERELFKLFVTLTMFQALRDVVIMRHQRALTLAGMRVVADLSVVSQAIADHPCDAFHAPDTFEDHCDISKDGTDIDCGMFPGVACHVKDATRIFNRMGDMGKLPTSAWLRLWQGGGMQALLEEVCREEASPTKRAGLLVARFAAVHRVGRKLATMFVSALSTPALAPGLTPWFPKIDGNELVVVDTNVARAVDALRAPGAAKTYDARANWVCEQAAKIDLRVFQPDLPAYSPRLVQEALYNFCSKSNRVARGDGCVDRTIPCMACAPRLCPFPAAKRLRDVLQSTNSN